MKTVAEALALVLEQARPLPLARVRCENALGLILAEEIASDVDSPPHDKSIVDGYAVDSRDFTGGSNHVADTLRVLEEVTAGQCPTQPITPGSCTRIMTGAPIPVGADAVVMVERTTLVPAGDADGEKVRVHDSRVTSGMNIMRRGTSLRTGQAVLTNGCLLRGIELGLLAEVGRTEALVVPQPRVGVIATGNELIPAAEKPGPGQIRNSNEPMLMGLTRSAGAIPVSLGIAADTVESLQERIAAGLRQCDVVLLSGGVSAGVLDLVPATLAAAGVREVFHKVNLKPGKPLWFGVREEGGRRQLVFGLPGNPVSSLVGFELFVRPAIGALAGHADPAPRTLRAVLQADHTNRGDRATYWPARLVDTPVPGSTLPPVTPLRWQGSGDLRTLSEANALVVFSGDGLFAAGTEVEVVRL